MGKISIIKIFKRFKKRIILFSVFLVFGIFLFCLLDIYIFKPDLFFGKFFSRFIPFPAIYNDGNFISYNKYEEFLGDYKIYFLFDNTKSENTYKQGAIKQLLSINFVNNLARKLNVVCIRDGQFGSFKGNFYKKNNINKNVLDELVINYNFDEMKFEDYVILPNYCVEKISEKLSSLEDNSGTRRKIDEIYSDILENPEKFIEYSDKYRDENMGSIKELGWLPKKDLPDNLSQMIDNMIVGDISPVLRSVSGYHIYKINGIVEGKDGNFYELSQVFLSIKGLNDYISEYFLKGNFKILVD